MVGILGQQEAQSAVVGVELGGGGESIINVDLFPRLSLRFGHVTTVSLV